MDWFATALGDRYRRVAPIDRTMVPTVFAAAGPGVPADVAVAIVELPADPGAADRLAERLLSVAEATAELRHPGWARVLDAGRVELGARSAIYVVRERCAGESLAAVLEREGPLPVRRAVHLVRDLLRPLREAASRRLAHGDLAAQQVWLDGSEGARLSEPGIADCVRTILRTTELGSLPIGGLQVLAPEQARFEPADARSDIHALGGLLHRMVTRAVRDEALPADLNEVIAACLAPDPAARFQRVEDLARALEKLDCFERRPGTGRRLRRRSDDEEPVDPSPVVLTIVHHPDERWVAAQADLSPGTTLLGRDHDPFHGALSERRVSRRHARLELRGSRVLVTDESRNGTFADGAVVGRESASVLALAGRQVHVLRLGQVLLMLRQGTERTDRPPLEHRLAGISASMKRLRRALERAATSDDPVLLTGEPGSGRRHAAAEIHERSPRRTRSMVTVDCAALSAATLREALLEGELLRTALRGRTLLLAHLDQAPDDVREALPGILLAIDRGVARDRASAPRWIATVGPDPRRLDPVLRDRLGTTVLPVPPLADRPEDIPHLARHHLRAIGCDLVAELAETLLLTESWPENARSLLDHVSAIAGAQAPANLGARPEYVVVAPRACRTYAAALIRVLDRYRRVVFWFADEHEERARSVPSARFIFVGGPQARELAAADRGAHTASAGTRWGVVGKRGYIWVDDLESLDPDAEALELELGLNRILQKRASADPTMFSSDALPEGRALAGDFVGECPLFEPVGRGDPRRVLADRRHIHTVASFLHDGIHRLDGGWLR